MSDDVTLACMMQGVYVFYLQLVTDMLHLCVYVVFFVIVFTNYGLPLHLVSFGSSNQATVALVFNFLPLIVLLT